MSSGCAAYEPSLPFHETMDTQRMKKNWLKEQASKSQRDITCIKVLLQETYPLQRMEFNYRKGTIYSCLESWPFERSKISDSACFYAIR